MLALTDYLKVTIKWYFLQSLDSLDIYLLKFKIKDKIYTKPNKMHSTLYDMKLFFLMDKNITQRWWWTRIEDGWIIVLKELSLIPLV